MSDKVKMINWVKPSGAKVQTNDLSANIAKAESLGWKRAKGRPAKGD